MGRTSRTCASPGAERAGAAVRRGHHRRHADGRCARHDRSAPPVEHAVALVLRQPGHELAGGVEAVLDTAAARRVEAGRLTQAAPLNTSWSP